MTKNRQVDSFIVTKDDGSRDLVSAGLMERYAIKAKEDQVGSKQIKDDGFEYGDVLYEPLYNPEKLCELLEINTYHAQCCDVVSRDAAGLGWTLNKSEDQEGEGNLSTKKKISAWLKQIAPNLNKDLLYKRGYDRRSMGYGAIEVVRKDKSNSDVTGLSHIPSQHLRRAKDGYRVKQQIGTETVWFILYGSNRDSKGKVQFDIGAEDGKKYDPNTLTRDKRANELLWSMDYTPKSQYYGLAKVVPAIKAILGDTSRSEYNTSFFKNYGMPAFAVLVSGDFEDYDKKPGDPDYDETKTLKWKISQQIKEVIRNPHSAITILVPSEGEEGNVEIELKPLSVETKEASFIAYRRDNRDEVLAAHRVPGFRIGINDKGAMGGDNSKDSTEIYKMSVIEPLQADNEVDINLLIREKFGDNVEWEFKLEEIDTKDMLKDVQICEKLVTIASMKPKEVRAYFSKRYGLKEDSNPYLDEYYLNGKPLDQVWTSGGIDPPGTSQVLSNLENDLGGGTDEIDPEDDSLQSGAIKNAFNRLRNRISAKTSS